MGPHPRGQYGLRARAGPVTAGGEGICAHTGLCSRFYPRMLPTVHTPDGVEFSEFLLTLDRRGRGFEDATAWFLANDPVYRQQVKRTWLWQDWPGCWGRDCGIDLVAETVDGELWAIQAKNYGEQTTVTKADVDTFLSESARPVFSYRLLVASTDRLARNARQAIEGQEKPVGLLLRSQLESSPLDWSLAARQATAKPKPRPLREHQREALAAVVAGFRGESRGQLVMACGTGKTRVGLAVAEKLRSQRTLVLVPSLLLLAQTAREWALDARLPFRSRFVCSDESVADKAGAGYDEPISNVADLGLPVTTDPRAIARFLAGEGSHVVFSTYQSSPALAEAMRQEPLAAQLAQARDGFDLIVADEAHRCAGTASGVFATVLDDGLLPGRRRLFMTATPRVYATRVREAAEEQEVELASMDDPDRFGPVLHRLSFAGAIDRDLLSDYRVLVVGVTDEEARRLAESGAFVTPDGEQVTDARSLARAIGLLKAIRDYDLRRLISFHGRIKRASGFASLLDTVTGAMPAGARPRGQLETAYISGEMAAGARKRLLSRLRELPDADRMLLANARCLTEGVDVPALDGVAFIDPRSSQIDIVQAVGRAMRRAEDKTLGTIIIPVFIGADDDPEDMLESSEFQPVWQTVNALRSHDESLGEEIDAIRRGLGRTGTVGRRPGKLVLDLPRQIDFERFSNAFNARLITCTGSSFALGLGALEEFVEHHGHARVPWVHETEAGFRLGRWCGTRRQERKRGKLPAERIKTLNTLGFAWDPHEGDWQQGLAALEEFVTQHGNARVPQSYTTETRFNLGRWCSKRRQEQKRGELAVERIAALDALGFAWEPLDDDWQQGLAALEEFVDQRGDARVPHTHETEAGFRLGAWCGTRRQDRRRGKVAAERIKALDALGFVWDPFEDDWQQGLAALEGFVDQHRHARVHRDYATETEFKLGRWCSHRREEKKRGKLTVERVAALDALGFVWDPREDGWQQGLAALEEFVDQHGHARVPLDHLTESGFKARQMV
jgi:superfamily II DNA or RNA helicase